MIGFHGIGDENEMDPDFPASILFKLVTFLLPYKIIHGGMIIGGIFTVLDPLVFQCQL